MKDEAVEGEMRNAHQPQGAGFCFSTENIIKLKFLEAYHTEMGTKLPCHSGGLRNGQGLRIYFVIEFIWEDKSIILEPFHGEI